jgi:uncharacterized protein YbjT (DUF2867 family)
MSLTYNMNIDCINNSQQPLIVIIGASGFVGKNLVSELLAKTPYQIRAVARDIKKFEQSHPRLEIMSGDVTSSKSLRECLNGATLVFFLVHKLESKAGELYVNEANAASAFALAVKEAGVRRVIYVSGLGLDEDKLSRHLASRHNTGDILRQHVPEVIEFRASIIVGQGSISFEIIRHLINKLPILILPKYAKTLTQPIGISDILQYLLASISLPLEQSEIIEIGGPEKMSYQDLLSRYAHFLGKRRLIFCFPIMPLWLASWFLYLLTPQNIAQIGRNMTESFQNEMVVTNSKAEKLFPEIIPQAIEKSFL